MRKKIKLMFSIAIIAAVIVVLLFSFSLTIKNEKNKLLGSWTIYNYHELPDTITSSYIEMTIFNNNSLKMRIYYSKWDYREVGRSFPEPYREDLWFNYNLADDTICLNPISNNDNIFCKFFNKSFNYKFEEGKCISYKSSDIPDHLYEPSKGFSCGSLSYDHLILSNEEYKIIFCPIISFTPSSDMDLIFNEDDHQGTLMLTTSYNDILWDDLRITGSCDTSNLGSYLSSGDVIKNCSGQIMIIHIPTSNIIGRWFFEKIVPEFNISHNINEKIININPNDVIIEWHYFSIDGNCDTSNLGRWVSKGDLISDCYGNITLIYTPNNEIVGTWEFE